MISITHMFGDTDTPEKKMKAHMECVRLWVYVYQIKLHIEQTLTTFTNNTGKIV